ncbi:MAG: DUF6240 domain-containing protein [Cellulosilyticaceae bacterium]
MIEAIRKPISAGVINEKIVKKNKGLKETERETVSLELEDLKTQIQPYFYHIEDQINQNKKLESNLLDVEIAQIKSLLTQGYDLEALTIEEIKNLKEGSKRIKQSDPGVVQQYEKANLVGEKVDRLKQHPESMYIYGVNHQGKLSINDLYKGSYTVQGVGESKAYSFEQVSNILKLNGMDSTKGNQWAANTLLSLGLEVSQENIVKIQNIKVAVDGLEKEEEIQKAEEDMASGDTPGERPLLEDEKMLYVEKDIQEIIEELAKVKEDDIRETLLVGKEITIGNLREVMHLNTEKALGKTNQLSKEAMNIESKVIESGLEEQTKQTKEQLREIRARLNAEAAIKISEKMPLESTELTKLVKELKAMEEQDIKLAIQKVDLPSTPQVKQLIKETLQITRQISKHRDIVMGVELEQKEQNTLEDVGKVINAYEENFLKIEKRFGETAVKVADQIEDFLLVNNIEATEENISAAKALIANKMDITITHIEEAARILDKINLFLEEMTPERAAVLIKEGINPYKASINQILEWVSIEQLPKLKNSIAEAIVGLEIKGQISEIHKQSLLGLYRIVGGLTQNKEEIVGYLYKNQLPLTIDKLEEAVKYVKQTGHIAVSIDDQFGELQELKYTEQTAKQMIQGAHKENNKLLKVLEEIEQVRVLFPDQTQLQIADIGNRIYPFIKTQVRKELSKLEGGITLSPSIIEKLNRVKEISPQIIDRMNKQGIPLTLSNIYWMEKLVENPELYIELIEAKDLPKDIFKKDIDELEKVLEELRQENSQGKEISAEKGDIGAYRNYKKLEEVTTLQKQLIDKEGLYQIPFSVEGQTKLVNLYINKKASKKNQDTEEIKAVITYRTKELGTVVAKLEIQDEKINYSVQGETQEITKKLKQSSSQLSHLLKGIGYLVIGDEYTVEQSEPVVLNPSQNKRGDSYFEIVV